MLDKTPTFPIALQTRGFFKKNSSGTLSAGLLGQLILRDAVLVKSFNCKLELSYGSKAIANDAGRTKLTRRNAYPMVLQRNQKRDLS
ncbi:MAG: hypothetical protein CM15mV139_310 [Caudoviricetes sp.]|nr:MAG: hypothetical protein CM15mV139_310 [Caudoviricetes sp.]